MFKVGRSAPSRDPVEVRPVSAERSEFGVERSAPRGAVFLSYASQDAEAAKRIAEALRAAGVEVWFDQNELVGGDAWDAKIRRQIAECALFLPVISASTQARREGYFRLEWKLAAQRTHMMSDDTPFLLPVVIDETRDAEARVPAEFKGVQWTRLRGGEAPASFCTRVQRLLAGDAAPAPAVAPAAPAAARPAGRSGRKFAWLGYGGAAVALGLGLLYALRPLGRPGTGAHSRPVAAAPAERDPLARALELRALDGLSRERLAAADDLLAQALKADPTNALALALAAQVDALMVYRSWDPTDERRLSASSRSARAAALAPEAFESRRAQALVAGLMLRTPAALKEAETIYRSLVAERPDDRNVLEELGVVLQTMRRFDDAAEVFLRAGRPQLAGVAYYGGARFADARRIADEMLAQRRSAAALVLKANVALFGANDLAAARAAVDQFTPTELREDDAAGAALRLAVLSRDPEGLLRLLEPFPHPFVSILGVNYPRQYWTGLAREWQRRPEAARTEWRGALRVLEERLQENPADVSAIGWSAMIHSCLGDSEATERALKLYANYSDLSTGRWDFNYCIPLLRLGGREDEVTDRLARTLREPLNGQFSYIVYAWARFSPELDPLRGRPRFEQLLREVRPKDALPFADEVAPSVPAAPAVDEKSVAVLAFANLSDDKANEYFSDGISEELLNVLAKVGGLKVTARTSAFHFKGRNTPIPEIARTLGVAYVVEGSVRRAGDKVRIQAKLVKAADGFQVWSDTFTRDVKDVFAVQDEIAGLIARNISPKLTQAAAPTATRPVDPEAFQLYLEGRALARKAGIDDLRQAIALFGRAVQRDAGFVLARAQQARAYVQLGRWGGMVPKEAWAAARAALAPALSAEPDTPEVLVAHGWILRTADWKWLEAEAAFARALELRPSDTDMLVSAAVLKAGIGRSAEAHVLAQRAVELDPLNPTTQFDLGLIYRFSDRLPEAERQFRRAIELSPGGQRYRTFLALVVVALGRREEAEELARDEPDVLSRLFVQGLAAAGSRDERRLRERITELESKRPTLGQLGDYSAYLASLRAAAGDLDGAMAELEVTRESRDPSIGWIKVNYLVRPLHVHPRWPEFLRSVGLADDQLK
jgi:TolB-like protein/tetratricopeptide (TPR) repeat protein